MQTLGFTVIRSNNFLSSSFPFSFKYFICDLSSQTCPRKNGDESSLKRITGTTDYTGYQGTKRLAPPNEWQVNGDGVEYFSLAPQHPFSSAFQPPSAFFSTFPVSPFLLILVSSVSLWFIFPFLSAFSQLW